MTPCDGTSSRGVAAECLTPPAIRCVGAYVDSQGMLSDFTEAAHICRFENPQGVWQCTLQFAFQMPPNAGLPEAKVHLRDMVSRLERCDAFLLRELRGLPRVTLEELGICVAQGHGEVTAALVTADRSGAWLATREAPKENEEVPAPLGDPQSGCYAINIVELLSSGSRHVSRDILIPFIETVSFHRLTIVCDHIPRWFAMELPQLGVTVNSIQQESPQSLVTIVLKPISGSRTIPIGRRPRASCGCGG